MTIATPHRIARDTVRGASTISPATHSACCQPPYANSVSVTPANNAEKPSGAPLIAVVALGGSVAPGFTAIATATSAPRTMSLATTVAS